MCVRVSVCESTRDGLEREFKKGSVSAALLHRVHRTLQVADLKKRDV